MYILCSYNKPRFGHFNSLVLRSFIENPARGDACFRWWVLTLFASEFNIEAICSFWQSRLSPLETMSVRLIHHLKIGVLTACGAVELLYRLRYWNLRITRLPYAIFSCCSDNKTLYCVFSEQRHSIHAVSRASNLKSEALAHLPDYNYMKQEILNRRVNLRCSLAHVRHAYTHKFHNSDPRSRKYNSND